MFSSTCFLVFSALILLTRACIPPFNDFRYADNTTLLQAAVIRHEANPAMGWSHILNGKGPAEHWPTGADGIVHIQYCFDNEKSKRELGSIIIKASELWRGATGNAGQESGHRMGGFSEYTKDGDTPFCYSSGRWNDKVPVGTLVVRLFPNPQDGGGQASLGYRPSDWEATPDRHQLRMSSPVLGDQFVHFECSNLIGYAAAKALADSSTTMTIDKLCHSSVFGRLPPYVDTGFRPFSYSTEDYWEMSHKDKNGNYDGQNHPYSVTSDPAMYDYESLMHYSSFENMNSEKKGEGLKGLPLVKWKDGKFGYVPPNEVTDKNAELLVYTSTRVGPTSKDVGITKALYGWGA
ncbi:hypothetical protein FB567DRAFT_542809 [Paraphoma chrysanthemicola]|uniref:Metalloendopeptidase n=1 Tax=Paraphoma chrysanthemicola TaxID=798071 RepID=A0A8K0RJ64_9PLEO|nr:hypothetical protein FB567DRAFT_542809 [Paraphoma chrysanthemicola]